jgi:hypothetical protein
MGSEPKPPFRLLSLVRNDGAHRAANDKDDLYDSPAYQLGAGDPHMLEKLGELDDVVFEAIAGRGTAIDRLRVLWSEALGLVGPDLVDESRQAYLRHAMAKWHECAEAEPTRNPRLAITLMDVLAVLLDDRISREPTEKAG